MRQVPSAISTGFSSNLVPFLLVVMEGSGGNTYYWPTHKKNELGNTATIKMTSGGAALTIDSTMIALEVDKASRDGIGDLERSVDVYAGGGIGGVGNLAIDILNQTRFDQTIVTDAVNLEHRPLTVYFGFIPTGASPSVIVEDDMVQIWAGVVEDLNDYNYGDFSLGCVDGSFQIHQDIPTTVINSSTFPNAPKENRGKPLPLLWGDFSSSDEDLDRDMERIRPAPTVKTDEFANEFYLADHELHTLGNSYFFSSGSYIYGAVQTAPTSTNDASGGRISWSGILTDLIVSFVQRLKNVQVSSANISLTNYAVDDDEATYATDTDTVNPFLGGIPRPTQEGELCDSAGSTTNPGVRFRYRFEGMSGTGAELFVYRTPAGAMTDSVEGYSDADANSFVRSGTVTTSPVITWDNFGSFRFGIKQLVNLTQVRIKNMAIEYFVKVGRLTYVDPAKRRFYR